MNNTAFKVRNIIGEPVDGLSRVTVDIDTFEAIRQSLFARKNKETALLNFSRNKDGDGNYVSIFNFNGVKVYNLRDNASKKTVFLMDPADATRNLVPITDEPGLPFKLSNFNLNIVATT